MTMVDRAIGIFLLILIVFVGYILLKRSSVIHALSRVDSASDAMRLMPTSPTHIRLGTQNSIEDAREQIKKIIAIPDEQRTYENTMQAFDQLQVFSDLAIQGVLASIVEMVNSDATMRETAHTAALEIQQFAIEQISNNFDLFKAIKAYAQGNALKENLSDEQTYFISETIKGFKRAGLDANEKDRDEIKKIKKELSQLEMDFDRTIAQDHSTFTATRDELDGVSPDLINSLKKDDQGNYIVGVDQPTYMQIMENCTVEATREKMWNAYENRAYPSNKEVLEKIIQKRDQLAKLLGYANYADYELADQMVGSPKRAQEFLDQLTIKCRKKAALEFAEFTALSPELLNKDGKLSPWNVAFVKNNYKKEKLSLDENKVAEYFPVDQTVAGLFDIYQKFFNLTFESVPVKGLWDPSVTMLSVVDNATGVRAGYLFLDLYPRANKYSHACEITLVPVSYGVKNKENTGVAMVIANFPKPTEGKPALLMFKDVNTFFHEFGHALHALMGRTQVASFSGTHVKRDFVEMPSQMLEEWLSDKAILKMISHHYKTGQPLPDSLIDAILRGRTYDAGMFLVRQLFFAKYSLEAFQGPVVNLDELNKKIFQNTLYGIDFDPRNHFYAAFGHLTGYGAGYYGYLWSKVFAFDLFAQIKKEGLLNPDIGTRYTQQVIGKGGSKDPNELLRDFLGRDPIQEPFLRDMGLNQ